MMILDEDIRVAVQSQKIKRQRVSDWFRVSPHRLHLGVIGWGCYFRYYQKQSDFEVMKVRCSVGLLGKGMNLMYGRVCHPAQDMISAHIDSHLHTGIKFSFSLSYRYSY